MRFMITGKAYENISKLPYDRLAAGEFDACFDLQNSLVVAFAFVLQAIAEVLNYDEDRAMRLLRKRSLRLEAWSVIQTHLTHLVPSPC